MSAVSLLVVTFSGAIPAAHGQPARGKENAPAAKPPAKEKPATPTEKAPASLELERRVFAGPELVKHPLGLCLDEANRVCLAETRRFFGRGVIESRGRPRRETDDLQTLTLEDRLRFLHAWKEDRELRPEFRLWPEGSNPEDDFFTRFSEQVVVLEDTDGDGRADKRTVAADGFNDPLDGPGAGVFKRGSKTWFACVPHLWLLEDTTGDGVADSRRKLATGFGVRTGWFGHDLKGIVPGPDGRLYFCMGDRGFHVGTEKGKFLEGPGTGGIFRCWPDGSGLEVMARGLRDPQDLAFDEKGNLFAVDNGSEAGDKPRILFVPEGGEFGWEMPFQTLPDRGAWLREEMWQLPEGNHKDPMRPAWVLPPVAHVGASLAGMASYPGTGLPKLYDGSLFVCDFRGSHGQIEAVKLRQRGAGFELQDRHTVDAGPSANDVAFGYDGRLYVSVWGDGWEPNEQGHVYTLAHEKTRAAAPATEVAALFRRGFENLPAGDLPGLLGHADSRVRLAAQTTLAGRGGAGAEILAGVARDASAKLFARLHAVWGIGMSARGSPDAARPLIELLQDRDESVRAQVVKTLSDLGWPGLEDAGKTVRAALGDPSARVRFFAAIASGRIADDEAIPALAELLAREGDHDPFLRHAAVVGLAGCGGPAALVFDLGRHKSRAVRLGVVLALRRHASPLVEMFLHDEDAQVAAEAARAIYDLSIDDSLPRLAAMSGNPEALPKAALSAPFLRRALRAGFRLGREEDLTRLADFAASRNPAIADDLRMLALDLLVVWPNPPARDGIWGRWSPLKGRSSTPRDAEFKRILPAMRERLPAGPLKTRVEELDRKHNTQEPESLLAVVGDESLDSNGRLSALEKLFEISSEDNDQVLAKACAAALQAENAPELRARARTIWAQKDSKAGIPLLVDAIDKATQREKQDAIAALGRLTAEAADLVLARLMRSLITGTLHPAIQLDTLEAAQRRRSPVLRSAIHNYKDELLVKAEKGEPYAEFAVCLQGGDPESGKRVFFTDRKAQCLRCHTVDGRGGIIGPDLSAVGKARNPAYLLESLVNPHAEIVKGYGLIQIALKDGKKVSGILDGESGKELIVDDGQGKRRIPKSEISSRHDPNSAMPPMAGFLTKRQIRDLVAYLATLKG